MLTLRWALSRDKAFAGVFYAFSFAVSALSAVPASRALGFMVFSSCLGQYWPAHRRDLFYPDDPHPASGHLLPLLRAKGKRWASSGWSCVL